MLNSFNFVGKMEKMLWYIKKKKENIVRSKLENKCGDQTFCGGNWER